MRVLVIGQSYMTRFAQAKYQALARLHQDTRVLGLVPTKWPEPLYGNLTAQELHDRRVRFVGVPIALSGWPSRYFFTSPRAASLVASFGPDIVQVEHEPAAIALLQVRLLLTALGQSPKIVLFSWENLRVRRNILMNAVASSLEHVNLGGVSHAIAGNDDAVGILRRKGYAGPITILPQVGVDPTHFSPGDGTRLRREVGLGGSFVVGFAGRIVHEKGLRTLARALSRMPQRDWRVLLVGRGPLLQEIRTSLASVGLGKRLVHVASVPHLELPQYYRCMDVLVLPSETVPTWKEQFGHVLIEAMACGVPVIGSSSGSIPAVIGKAGLIFAEGDDAELAHCLARIADDHELRDSLVNKGHRMVEQRYSHEAVARGLHRIYQDVLRR